jgi:hypothetical protein
MPSAHLGLRYWRRGPGAVTAFSLCIIGGEEHPSPRLEESELFVCPGEAAEHKARCAIVLSRCTLLIVKGAEINLVVINLNLGAPPTAVRSKTDALEARRGCRQLLAVPHVLSVIREPQVFSPIVQAVPIYMIPDHPSGSIEHHLVHSESSTIWCIVMRRGLEPLGKVWPA